MARQLKLDLLSDDVLSVGADAPGVLGEVFTRRWVVELILDLAGYVPERDLARLTAVEPAVGQGAFLGPMIDRLVASCKLYGRQLEDWPSAVMAFDVASTNVDLAQKSATTRLVEANVSFDTAELLARQWVRVGDFLLEDLAPQSVDYVLGNPPYVRLENTPKQLSAAYRAACPTMRGRSDIYVGFIERGLDLLRGDGTLGFIVADRWMHNQYGSELRRLVRRRFSVDCVVEMHDVDAFEDEVSAYPAITIVSRRRQGSAVLAATSDRFGPADAQALRQWASGRGRRGRGKSFSAERLPTWFDGDDLWPSGDPSRIAIVSELERRFPPLEDASTATRVGIGVATGADQVFITKDPDLVERDQLVPLAMASDTATGELCWSGSFLVNPWDSGRLADLQRLPRLAAYLRQSESALRRRHVARRRPGDWYRTIDRVDPALRSQPKLLIPDMKASSHPVLDNGQLYPHHNLYFIVSQRWDLQVLGGLLLSEVANLFVGTYCVKMRGGTYRFQAQYLRRIRVPDPRTIPNSSARSLARAFQSRDVEAATGIAQHLYGIAELPPR
ncbi:MAG: Eco57I restriction-modification methylase domain-containing protein [Acidimicrobiales bacterium]